MFRYTRTIFLRDTDATGVLYFSEQLKICQEVFEAYLSKKFTLNQMLREHDFLLPIVHAEADYSLPILVGDVLEIQLSLGDIGSSSFSLGFKVLKGTQEVGSAKIVHVALSKETGKSIPIPEIVLSHISKL